MPEDLLIFQLCPLGENAQEMKILKSFKNFTKSWRVFNICGRIQNLGRTQLESKSKIIIINVENSSVGYDLT